MGLKITKLRFVKKSKEVVEANYESQNSEDEICVVCQEPLDHEGDDDRTLVNLRCGHQFHLDCIGTSFNAKNEMKCPTCRNVESGRWMFAIGSQNPDFHVGNPTGYIEFTPNSLPRTGLTTLPVWHNSMPQLNSTSMDSLLSSTPQQQRSETSLVSSHDAQESILNRMNYGFDTTISNHGEESNNSLGRGSGNGNGTEISGSTVEEAATGHGVERRNSGSGCGCIHCRRFYEFIGNL